MKIEKPEERDQIKALKQRIRQSEKALAEAKVDEVFAHAQFEVACQELGVTDLGAIKKNSTSNCPTWIRISCAY